MAKKKENPPALVPNVSQATPGVQPSGAVGGLDTQVKDKSDQNRATKKPAPKVGK